MHLGNPQNNIMLYSCLRVILPPFIKKLHGQYFTQFFSDVDPLQNDITHSSENTQRTPTLEDSNNKREILSFRSTYGSPTGSNR